MENEQLRIGGDGTVEVLDNGNVVATLSFQSKEDIYRLVKADYVAQDVLDHAPDYEVNVSEEEAQRAGRLFSYDCKYDCNLTYWENIENLIDSIKE